MQIQVFYADVDAVLNFPDAFCYQKYLPQLGSFPNGTLTVGPLFLL
jgi:hypothetical protein